ncbi:MAG: peptidase S1, partial [Solirubrobacteraceae bacterium]
RPGNSGGPMVDARGQVVATVFAAITGSPSGRGGFAVPNGLIRKQLAESLSRTHAVSTQECAG